MTRKTADDMYSIHVQGVAASKQFNLNTLGYYWRKIRSTTHCNHLEWSSWDGAAIADCVHVQHLQASAHPCKWSNARPGNEILGRVTPQVLIVDQVSVRSSFFGVAIYSAWLNPTTQGVLI